MAKTLISAISKNYATALMDVASEDNSYDKFEIQLGEIYDVLCSSKDLQIVMTNSSISTEKKIQILSEIFGGKIEKKLINFLKILSEFEERLILLGFEGIFRWNWVIFGVVGMAKNIDFSRFCRTRYRTQNGG